MLSTNLCGKTEKTGWDFRVVVDCEAIELISHNGGESEGRELGLTAGGSRGAPWIVGGASGVSEAGSGACSTGSNLLGPCCCGRVAA